MRSNDGSKDVNLSKCSTSMRQESERKGKEPKSQSWNTNHASRQKLRTNSTRPHIGNTNKARIQHDHTGQAGKKQGPATCNTNRNPIVRNFCRGLLCTAHPAGARVGGVESSSSCTHTGQVATLQNRQLAVHVGKAGVTLVPKNISFSSLLGIITF
jgi:hypothetical protein